MPKVSKEHQEARRQEILAAAWTCFQRDGLHATTMRDIVRESGLSAGAVYSYFPGKEELILAAVGQSLGALGRLVEPLLAAEPPLPPGRLLGELAAAIDGFARRERFDLRRIALLGWAEAQRSPRLLAAMQPAYRGFRDRLEGVAGRWAEAGLIAADADRAAVARAMLALVLGHVVEAALLGEASPERLAQGLAALPVGGL